LFGVIPLLYHPDIEGGSVKVFTAFALSASLCLTTAPLIAAEGLLIIQKTTVGTRVRTSQVQIEKERMRTEIEGVNGEKQVIVFDGPKRVLTMIYPDRKAYAELTKAEADQMGVSGQVTMSPAMREQMAKMPPAQRALMEQMMRGRATVSAAPPPKMEYRRAGSDKAGKWACDKYEGFQNNVKKMEICTVAPRTLGVAATDLDIARQMAAFFAKMAPQGAGPAFEVGTVETVGFSGLPVRSIGYGSKGEVVYASEISEVSQQNFAASSYAVPAGFQKQAMFGARGSRP
jgi:hypothetical protein